MASVAGFTRKGRGEVAYSDIFFTKEGGNYMYSSKIYVCLVCSCTLNLFISTGRIMYYTAKYLYFMLFSAKDSSKEC